MKNAMRTVDARMKISRQGDYIWVRELRHLDLDVIVGVVDSVRETAKGTLVVLHSVESSDDGVKPVYKSLYLNTMETYTCRETESWPVGVTRAEYLVVVGA